VKLVDDFHEAEKIYKYVLEHEFAMSSDECRPILLKLDSDTFVNLPGRKTLDSLFSTSIMNDFQGCLTKNASSQLLIADSASNWYSNLFLVNSDDTLLFGENTVEEAIDWIWNGTETSQMQEMKRRYPNNIGVFTFSNIYFDSISELYFVKITRYRGPLAYSSKELTLKRSNENWEVVTMYEVRG
jgi:hypothetical protein